jgi:hypothetical protein
VFLNGDADWKRDPKTHLFVLDEKQKTQVRDTNDWVRFAERISKDNHLPGIYLARPGLDGSSGPLGDITKSNDKDPAMQYIDPAAAVVTIARNTSTRIMVVQDAEDHVVSIRNVLPFIDKPRKAGGQGRGLLRRFKRSRATLHNAARRPSDARLHPRREPWGDRRRSGGLRRQGPGARAHRG